MPQAAMTSSILEVLRRLGANMPDLTSGATVPLPEGPGDPGYDPNTLANRVAEPSVMDPTWLQALRASMNTAGRVGESVKGMITGGNEQPGPSAENFGAIIAALGPLLGKIVYHGSPSGTIKRLSQDSPPKRTQIKQSYRGRGVYLTDSEDLAREHYTGSLFASQLYPHSTLPPNELQAWQKANSARLRIARETGSYPSGRPYEPKGFVYTVDLPDESMSRFLDADAPLSQQPQLGLPESNKTGWEFAQEVGVDELKRRGIAGIVHDDRWTPIYGARNYVVFDDQLPKIVKVER